MIGNHVYPQGYRGFESLSLRQQLPGLSEQNQNASQADQPPPFAGPFAPPDEAVLEGAIARVTAALVTADDEAIPELVAERRALREELSALREEVGRLLQRQSNDAV